MPSAVQNYLSTRDRRMFWVTGACIASLVIAIIGGLTLLKKDSSDLERNIDPITQIAPQDTVPLLEGGTITEQVQQAELSAVADRNGRTTPFNPDYDKSLSKALIIYGSTFITPRLNLIEGLPTYTEVKIITDNEAHRLELQRILPTLSYYDKRSIDIVVGNIKRYSENFAQDTGKGTSDTFFVSKLRHHLIESLKKLGIGAYPHDLWLPGGDIRLARNINGDNIVFVGSNAMDQSYEILRLRNHHMSKLEIGRMNKNEYKQTFQGADRVEILQSICLSGMGMPYFHLDQSSQFIADGLAVVEKLPNPSDANKQLVQHFLTEFNAARSLGPLYRYRGTILDYFLLSYKDGRVEVSVKAEGLSPEQQNVLQSYKGSLVTIRETDLATRLIENERRTSQQGFTVIPLETTIERVAQLQSYANLIAYKHRDTGQLNIRLPIYPDDQGIFFREDPQGPIKLRVMKNGKVGGVRNFWLTGENHQNYNILQKRLTEILGEGKFKIKPVPSEYKDHGNAHCIIYQLSYIKIPSQMKAA